MGETMSETRGFIIGVIGGIIGGILATLGLAKKYKVEIKSDKQTIQKRALDPETESTLLQATRYKFAIILFHGDGDPQVELTVKVNDKTYTLSGDEQAMEIIANETVEIATVNTDTASPRNTPTIEVASISW
jgi:ribonucleotide monophosphatase NagD (HAD superfamily)